MEADEKLMHYQTLGLSSLSSKEETKKAYRKLAKKYHPDVNPEDSNAEKRFKDITTAYQELMSLDETKAEEPVEREQGEHGNFHNEENSTSNFKSGNNSTYQHKRQYNREDFEAREKVGRGKSRGYREQRYPGAKHNERDERAYYERMMKRAAKRSTQSKYKVPAVLRLAMYFFLAIFSGIILVYVARHKSVDKVSQKQASSYTTEEETRQEMPGTSIAIPDNEDIIGNLQKNIIIDMRERREQAWRDEWRDDNVDSPERRMQEKEMERTYNMKSGEEPVTLY